MLLICMLVWGAASAEDVIWTEGTLDYCGHEVGIHAIVEDELPDTLHKVCIIGSGLKTKALMQALRQHFELHPAFRADNSQVYEKAFISIWADGFSNVAGYDAQSVSGCTVEELFPVADPVSQSIYERCIGFLQSMGIQTGEHTGYVRKVTQKGKEITIVLLPYRIDGLYTEYTNQIVHRDSMPKMGCPAPHLMDYPWADFVFDDRQRLVKLDLAALDAVSHEELPGAPIPWKQAAVNVLEAVVADRIGFERIIEGIAGYHEEQFWQQYRVQLSRVMPMWMPNWNNVCLPGWCVQFQLYDTATEQFVYAPVYCADMLTGEVARYRPDR